MNKNSRLVTDIIIKAIIKQQQMKNTILRHRYIICLKKKKDVGKVATQDSHSYIISP